jgi:hypothetical protein
MKEQKELKTSPINMEQFYVKSPPYFQTANNNLDYLVSHMGQDSPTPLCFVGPKGTGKTLVIAHYASENNIPIIQYDCSENTRKGDLIGRYILRGDETEYQLGVLPTAIELANDKRKAILVLEELNALAPNMQKQLNQLLDWRRHVFADNGKTYKLNKGAKLLVCATMNPSTYGGVFELNEDLISRWAQVWVEFPTVEEEKSIVNLNGFNVKLLPFNSDGSQITTEQIWRLVGETRTDDALSYALSPRDTVQLLQGYQSYLFNILKTKFGIESDKAEKNFRKIISSSDPTSATGFHDISESSSFAFRMALNAFVVGKFQDLSEKETLLNRIDSIFGASFSP